MADLTKLSPVPPGCAPSPQPDDFLVRYRTAFQDTIPVPQTPNTDEATYSDKSGTYSKGLVQTGYGIVDSGVFNTFRHDLTTGMPTSPATVVLDETGLRGGTAKQNGPQGSFALQPIGGSHHRDEAC